MVARTEVREPLLKEVSGVPGGDGIVRQVLERCLEGGVRACIQCGACTGSCPMGRAMEFGPRLAIAALRAGQVDRVITSNSPWLCIGCLSCTARCPRKVDITETLVPALREALVVQGTDIPTELRDVFDSTLRYGNPLGQSPRRRANWARNNGTPIRVLSEANEAVDVLWHVGCYPSYHPRAQQVAEAMAEILDVLEVNFGIMGREERCTGDNERLAGEVGLFEYLVEQNLAAFEKFQFREVLVTDPHAYNALKNEYPKYGFSHQVWHYTQFLAQRLDSLSQRFTVPLNRTVAFHDPCYLGRKNGVYEAPRQLLQAIPGLHLVEMPRNRENSLCCGGGAGGMWLDAYAAQYLPSRLSEKRVLEASKAGADILAVACPFDLLRFEDAIKVTGLDDKLVVKDILELIRDAIGG